MEPIDALAPLTREQWLHRAAELLETQFLEPAGYPGLADTSELGDWSKLRMTVGWPSTGGLRKSKRVLGQCWAIEASKGGLQEIFISPTIDDAARVVDVLLHEMVHGAVGTKHKHDATFAAACRAVGLEGKPTATVAGEELKARIQEEVLSLLPAWPHVALDPSTHPKETTRVIKAYCPNEECETRADSDKGEGFSVRITRKWIERFAFVRGGELLIELRCPDCNSRMAIEAGPLIDKLLDAIHERGQ